MCRRVDILSEGSGSWSFCRRLRWLSSTEDDETFITRQTPGGPWKLRSILRVGIDGSPAEKFFDPIKAALTDPLLTGFNKGFYRPEAHLALVLITDTEDQSKQETADSISDFLFGLKGGQKDRILVYSAYASWMDTACLRDDAQKGYLERFFTLTNAKTFSLCSPVYGQKLSEISEDMIERVGKLVYLNRPPVVDTIRAIYGSQVLPNDAVKGWVYDPVRNALVLGSQIEWSVQPDGTELTVEFAAAQWSVGGG